MNPKEIKRLAESAEKEDPDFLMSVAETRDLLKKGTPSTPARRMVPGYEAVLPKCP